MNAFLDGTEVVYNPQKVRLTTIDGRKIDFDRTAGIIRVEDNNGNQLNITPTGITHSSGKSITFQRDAQGRISRIVDPMGNMLNYGYDGNGDMVEFLDQLNNRTTFTYDAKHNLIEIIDPLGNRAVQSEYDAEGRLVAMIDAKGRRIEFSHNITGREEIVTDALGHTTRVVYDEQGNILSHEKPVTIDGATVLARSQYAYNSQGNQTSIIDPDNLRWENTYNAFGHPLTMTLNPGGVSVMHRYTYTATGQMLTEADPNGDTTQFAYDASGNPNTWIDVDGRVSLLSYNSAGQVTQFQDSSGRITRVAYDASGNVQSRTDSLGNVTTYTHDANGNKLTQAVTRTIQGVQRRLTTRFEYNAMNQLTKIIDPLGQETRYAYNTLGKKASQTDKLGRVTTFEYDEVGALTRTNYPDGTTETRNYDTVGNLVEVVDREGLRTQYRYDELRRVIETILPNGGISRTIYSPGGRTVAQITPDGSRTDYEYDTAGRMILVRQPIVLDAISGIEARPEWHFEYDAGGRRTAIVNPKGNRYQFIYDSSAGTITVRMPDGTEVVEAKDQWGRTLRRTDPEGNQTIFEYLADTSRLIAVTLPAPAVGQAAPVWRFAYDEVGNRVSQTDPLGRITRFEYDEINRLTRVILPGGQTRLFSYDAIGKVIGLTDFDGSTSSFEFDSADRLVRKILPDGSITAFTYTPGGRSASVLDQRGLTSYSYDATGRLIRLTQPGIGDIEYAYDLLNRLTRITTPGGSTLYNYDSLGRLADVSMSGGNTDYAYDLAGNLTRLNQANGVAGMFVYDQNNRLTSLIYEKDTQALGSFSYTYTPSGRRATIAETGAATSFNYDRVGRLTQEIRTGTNPFIRQYEYDAAGNRTRLLADSVETLYSYDANDRLRTAGATTFTYDDKGNLTQRNDPGLVTTYAWTPDNRLASMTSGVNTVTYEYDADGIRVGKQSSQGTVRYLVDGLNPSGFRQVLEERDGSGALLKRYNYGVGLISSMQSDVELFYQPDGQGHIRMLTDASGQVATTYVYDGYGKLVAESGASGNNYLYTGQQFDSDASLYYLRARYYNPDTGRFLGQDPENGNLLNPVSLHRYLYAANDPVNFADPSGEDFTLAGFSFAQVISGGIRGIEYGFKLKKLCDVKGLAKVIPLAIGLRGWIGNRFHFMEKLMELVTPSISFGGANNSLISVGRGVVNGNLGSLIPSIGFSYSEEIFKHPLADLVPPPQRLMGDPKKLGIEVSPKSPTEVELKLTGTVFPSAQGIVGPITVQHTPSWALKSVSGGVGVEHPVCDIRVCGVISVGTVSAVVTGSVTASGLSSSAVSGSFEIGLKVEVPFLPEGSFTIIKIPDDFK
jgi:RHS repeat-associated protein